MGLVEAPKGSSVVSRSNRPPADAADEVSDIGCFCWSSVQTSQNLSIESDVQVGGLAI